MSEKNDLQVFLTAINRVHERIDGLASKEDVARVEGAVNRLSATVSDLREGLPKDYVSKEEQDKRCEACAKKQDAEGSRRRWYVGIILSVALTIGTIVGRWMKW